MVGTFIEFIYQNNGQNHENHGNIINYIDNITLYCNKDCEDE